MTQRTDWTASEPKPEVISIIAMGGYPRHHLSDLVDMMFSDVESQESPRPWTPESYGRHQYYSNSEGYQNIYFTNYSIPDAVRNWDVWDGLERMIAETVGDDYHTNKNMEIPKKPMVFEVAGQKYQLVAILIGYYHDSLHPDEDLYIM